MASSKGLRREAHAGITLSIALTDPTIKDFRSVVVVRLSGVGMWLGCLVPTAIQGWPSADDGLGRGEAKRGLVQSHE